MSGQVFIRVMPEEVEQHGPAAAIVLAQIRYRCASDGPGRIQREGHRWWRVSYDELGGEVGLSAKTVRGAVNALRDVVSAKHFPPLSNQSRAFRITKGDDAMTSQKTERADADQPDDRRGRPSASQGISKCPTGQFHLPHGASALPTREVEEGEEAAGSRLAAPAAAPSQQSANGKPIYHPRCRKHIHDAAPPSCPGCGDARKAAEEQVVAEQARADRERGAIVRAIDSCPDCDQFGRLDDLTDCPRHPNLRQLRAAS